MKKATSILLVIFFSFNILAVAGQDSWQAFKSTHFIVYYKNSPESFIEQISVKSEDYYTKITEDLGFNRTNLWLWDDRARIYVYDNQEDYQAQTGLPTWSQGSTMPGSKVIQAFVGDEFFLETTLPHEISHIIFREFVGFRNPAVPLWLEEGVASFQEKIKYAEANEILRGAMADNTFVDLVNLSKYQSIPKNYGEKKSIELFYLESFSLLNYLFTMGGRENFVSFCQALRDKRNLESAVSSIYNFSNLGELDKAWQAYVKNG